MLKNSKATLQLLFLLLLIPCFFILTGASTLGGSGCGTNNSSDNYTVGGTLTGLSGTVVLQNNGGNNLSLSADGSFTFSTPLSSGSSYQVSVLTQPSGQACSVANGSGSSISANVTNIVVTCSNDQFAVGGNLSGLLDGTSVVLQNNGGDNLSLSIDGNFNFPTTLPNGSAYDVSVLTQPADQACEVTHASGNVDNQSITNVSVICSLNDTSLSVSTTGIIPVNAGSGELSVTNTGSTTALNVSATLPLSWTDVIQDSSNCASLAPGATCQLSFTSTTAYIAQGNISITGDNVPTAPSTALAFSLNDYLVFATPSASTALVVSDIDAATQDSPGISWSATNNALAGIYQNSSAPPCDGSSEGDCTSGVIVAFYNTPFTDYAAGLCQQITSDNSGAVPAGTWFLPAVCQINSSDTATYGSNCAGDATSIYTDLYSLGFTINLTDNYWASTECADVDTTVTDQCNGAPATYGWGANFGGANDLFTAPKSFTLGARCVRLISY